MFYYSLTVIWPQMVTALYEKDSIMIGLMSGTLGGCKLSQPLSPW